MKSTYIAPTVITRGDVVRNTLSGKAFILVEDTPNSRRPSSGSNLSFGL